MSENINPLRFIKVDGDRKIDFPPSYYDGTCASVDAMYKPDYVGRYLDEIGCPWQSFVVYVRSIPFCGAVRGEEKRS